jgi:hypothetical protein
MLLKFFGNRNATAYLRGMADEFGESTNSIRHELNNLSKAGYLTANEVGRTIVYRANTQHPFYNDIRNLVHKYLGIDKIVEGVIKKLGYLHAGFIVGDYALGKDSGTIELVLVGDVDAEYVAKLAKKVERLIDRRVVVSILSENEYASSKEKFSAQLMVWGNEE